MTTKIIVKFSQTITDDVRVRFKIQPLQGREVDISTPNSENLSETILPSDERSSNFKFDGTPFEIVQMNYQIKGTNCKISKIFTFPQSKVDAKKGKIMLTTVEQADSAKDKKTPLGVVAMEVQDGDKDETSE